MKSVICVIVKDERLYIREWAEYHLKIGFDEIYVYEDYGSESHADLFADESRVHISTLNAYGIKNYHSSNTQFHLFRKFLAECKQKKICDWVAFIDIDEFIMFDDGYDLHRLEEEYAETSGVWLSWKNYGASGHVERPVGDVLKNYTVETCSPDGLPQWNVKSLVNVKHCIDMLSVHHCSGGKKTNGDGRQCSDMCYDKSWINHYFTKSFEDYCERMFSRGNMSNNFRSFDNFFESNPDLMPRRTELINRVRHRHCQSTMWLSRDLKLLSGGNIEKLNSLEKLWHTARFF